MPPAGFCKEGRLVPTWQAHEAGGKPGPQFLGHGKIGPPPRLGRDVLEDGNGHTDPLPFDADPDHVQRVVEIQRRQHRGQNQGSPGVLLDLDYWALVPM